MLVAYPVKIRLWNAPPYQTDSSWGVRERQRFVLYLELRRFLRNQISNGPASI